MFVSKTNAKSQIKLKTKLPWLVYKQVCANDSDAAMLPLSKSKLANTNEKASLALFTGSSSGPWCVTKRLEAHERRLSLLKGLIEQMFKI